MAKPNTGRDIFTAVDVTSGVAVTVVEEGQVSTYKVHKNREVVSMDLKRSEAVE